MPPDFYSMPPGVSPPQQLQNPDPFANLYLNEQSLRIDVQNMKYGEERMAARRYTPWDLFYYKELAFFIHGDNTMPDHIDGNSIPPLMPLFGLVWTPPTTMKCADHYCADGRILEFPLRI